MHKCAERVARFKESFKATMEVVGEICFAILVVGGVVAIVLLVTKLQGCEFDGNARQMKCPEK